MKTCVKCKRKKSVAQFYRHSRNRDGLYSYCIPCKLAYQSAYNAKWLRARNSKLDALKAGPCMDCGGRFPPECMDFDHVRGEKLFSLGSIRNCTVKAPWREVLAEIEKCDLVCSNCHRTRTTRRLKQRGS